MKKMLLMAIISICLIAWKAEEYLVMAGLLPPPAVPAQQAVAAPKLPAHKPMTTAEFARLAKTDPDAYKKFMASMEVPQEKGPADKLMNFFKTGKYE